MQKTFNNIQQNNYPTVKVVLGFALLGGGLGGAIVGLILLPIALSSKMIGILMLSVIFGSVIGFIPALISGLVISKLRIRLFSIIDYVKLVIIGFLSSFVFVLFVSLMNEFTMNDFYKCTILGFIGAISAGILGQCLLPKQVQVTEATVSVAEVSADN